MSQYNFDSEKSDAYQLGLAAYRSGEPSSLNPFVKVNFSWRNEWYEGWNDAWLEEN
ncbi:hypothetical protein GCM10011613_03750 [Cellvibrio zantedeschiae]|uniref:Uncharacterized protein n=1 Tax=Cellvibrio zantedeschiae TaxID=1237077 RepID=A0ABQ3APP5_9GAMM|nr:hypothetical protein [Cellvibrio zantedeschiae]GGY63308.1 hypothetical protein GCM10011613_03750 [Cellvibrio zantedeschiae]